MRAGWPAPTEIPVFARVKVAKTEKCASVVCMCLRSRSVVLLYRNTPAVRDASRRR